jgi:3-dehydroquinate dehydratase-2
MASQTILVLNGPNLNLLGKREPEIYGTQTLADIERAVSEHAGQHGLVIDFRQSNSEAELVDWVQESDGQVAGLIVNAGAYTHTSVALLDALRATRAPIVEVHLSNIFQRETFRHHSYISQVAKGVISGFGGQSYILALDALTGLIQEAGATAS